MIQLSQLYVTTGKTITLTIWTFVSNMTSLLFNMLSRFVIVFLPRSKTLNFIAEVISESKKIKSATVFTFSPSIYHEVMRLDAPS